MCPDKLVRMANHERLDVLWERELPDLRSENGPGVGDEESDDDED